MYIYIYIYIYTHSVCILPCRMSPCAKLQDFAHYSVKRNSNNYNDNTYDSNDTNDNTNTTGNTTVTANISEA